MSRGIPDLETRIERLRQFEQWRQVKPIDFESIVGSEMWTEHWNNLDRAVEHLIKSQAFADRLRKAIASNAPIDRNDTHSP